MYLYHNIENDLVIDVNQIYHRQYVMQQMKQRFASFGYREIHTSAFEPYDLYVQMNGTVNHNEMMKTIDNTGEVLVLRPDITIPLTQQIATNNKEIVEDLRYFYVLDVFRQAQESKDNRQRTQAGVEYFGNATPEADSEIIALSIELLQDIHFDHVKIELGHAGFFAQLIEQMNLNKHDLNELKQYIQAKNITEIEQLMKRINVAEDLKEIVISLPFLYGDPMKVIQQAKKLPLQKNMLKTLDNMTDIYNNLKANEMAQHIVIDLSLINHMDYYSDMIFQGFIENIGKPIIMGGRYNTLAKQFGAEIPAIGFACDLDVLAESREQSVVSEVPDIDVKLLYDPSLKAEVLQLAKQLRNQKLQVISYSKNSLKEQMPKTTYTVMMEESQLTLTTGTGVKEVFSTTEALKTFLKKERE